MPYSCRLRSTLTLNTDEASAAKHMAYRLYADRLGIAPSAVSC